MNGGLEYLFGAADRRGGYDGCWALDQPAEKRAFERFIDRVMARWRDYPGFHIYHYGAYETTAVKRLMSRYATREEEVDRLLRGRVFVDLHRVVRQGLRASVEGYSIKRLEPFHGFVRRIDLTTATRALVRFEAALESGEAEGHDRRAPHRDRKLQPGRLPLHAAGLPSGWRDAGAIWRH